MYARDNSTDVLISLLFEYNPEEHAIVTQKNNLTREKTS